MADQSVIAKMKFAVVDDHPLIREGMIAVLLRGGATDIEQFSNATELIQKLDSGNKFDFFILDLELPDLDGFVLIEMIRARNPQAKIIVSTVHDEIWTLRKLLSRDVNAIIYKSGSGNEITNAIHSILDGNNYYCDEVKSVMNTVDDKLIHPSSRELEVLLQIAQGKTSREIAGALFVSVNTVETHRKALFNKLGAVNVADLIIKAIDKGYLNKNNVIH
ncbi:MAG: response regulator transcription factor [Muribaculaceae bacterium]|nr:response regulator transcription factor [Muribaculaceae bacterium]